MAKSYVFRQDNWSGGMSQDELGGAGTVFRAEGVDLLKDKTSFTLGSGITQLASKTDSRGDTLVSSVLNTNVSQIWFGSTLYAYDYLLGDLFKQRNSSSSDYFCNSGIVTEDGGAKKGFVIKRGYVDNWVYDGSDNSTGAVLPSGIITDTVFNVPGSWTATGGWSVTGGAAVNSSGSAGSISQTTASEATTYYKIRLSVTAYTGTITVKMDGTSLGTISATGDQDFYWYSGASTNVAFSIESAEGATATIEFAQPYRVVVTDRLIPFTATGADTYLRPFYIDGNDIYFGAGSDVKVIDAATSGWTLDSTKLEIDRGQTVVAITKIGDLFYVYATDGSNGYQYLWDGASTAPERIIRWTDLPISNAANFGNHDYVICKDVVGKSCIYKVSGYSRQLLRQSGYVPTVASGRYQFATSPTNAVETVNGLLTIPGVSTEGGSSGLYAIGSLYPSYPDSFSKPYTGITGTVSALYQGQSGGYGIVVASKESTTKYLASFTKPLGGYSYTGVGYVELNPIVGQFGESQKKTASKYRIGYNITNANGYVKVYYRKDGDTSYTLHQTISGIQRGSETFPLGVDFYRIQFKIEVYSGSTSHAQNVYDFSLKYDVISNNMES